MVGRIDVNKIVPTAPRGTSDNRAASTAFVTGAGGAGPRTVLASATTFYVGTDGNDANSGLVNSAAGAWATLAHAISVLTSQYDFGGQTVTLQARSGHAAFTTQLALSSWVGGGAFIFDLAGGSITTASGLPGLTGDCVLDATAPLSGPVTIQNGTLSSGSGTGIRQTAPGLIKIGASLTFGANKVAGIICGGGGTVEIDNPFTISGGGAFFCFIDNGGQLTDRGTPQLCTISSNPTFSNTFAFITDAGVFIMLALAFSPATGAFTGSRFNVTANGVLNSNTRGTSFIPGSAAGTTGSGGQYI